MCSFVLVHTREFMGRQPSAEPGDKRKEEQTRCHVLASMPAVGWVGGRYSGCHTRARRADHALSLGVCPLLLTNEILHHFRQTATRHCCGDAPSCTPEINIAGHVCVHGKKRGPMYINPAPPHLPATLIHGGSWGQMWGLMLCMPVGGAARCRWRGGAGFRASTDGSHAYAAGGARGSSSRGRVQH